VTIDCVDDIPGAQAMCDWFERVPSIHDAYLTDLSVDLSGRGRMRVRAFRTTSAITESGHYVLDKHCAVHFDFDEIQTGELEGFTGDVNILFGLSIRKLAEGFSIDLDPVDGLGGAIVAKKLTLTCEPVDYDGKWPPPKN
jgi:hypothetical protein